jgi:hypothetical protein
VDKKLDNYFKNNLPHIESLISKTIPDGSLRGSVLSNSYIYLYDKLLIDSEIDLGKYLWNYLRIQTFYNKTDYLKEKHILKGYVCDNDNFKYRDESQIISIDDRDDIHFHLVEAAESPDDSEYLELLNRVHSLDWKYKKLFDLIFKEGICDNIQLSEYFNIKPYEVNLLKKSLKKALKINDKITWSSKKIKKIWK